MKIAVIQPKMIGDVLVTSVIFEALRQKFPTASLHYYINKNTVPVVVNNPNIDQIFELDPQQEKGIKGILNRLKCIRNEKYDVIIDSYAKLQTAIWCRFSGSKQTISFQKSYASFFYTNVLERNTTSFSIATKAIEHRLLLLQPLGIEFSLIRPKLYVTEQEITAAKQKLDTFQIDRKLPIIMISALGSSDSKTYPLPYMAKVLDAVARKCNQLLLNYMPNQKEQVLQLYKSCQPETQSKIFIDCYANSLREFMAMTHLCNALIGNEGGAVNMAKALDVPTFTIFSPQILKNDWNMFEDGIQHVSVHVNDYIPYQKQQNSVDLYQKFEPSFFEATLHQFLNHLKME